MSRASLVLMVLLLWACDEPSEESAPQARPAAPAPPAAPARCGAEEAWAGGEVLEAPDGARIFYRVTGPADAPPVVFLHGGPGYNAYGFERAVGERLASRVRLVTLDQRGCGRSAGGAEELALGMDPTVADVERLRAHLGIAQWAVIGHSFGGLVALAYVTRHPDAVSRVVLVEATADPPAVLEHQVRVLAESAAADHPEIAGIAAEERPVIDRLVSIFQTLGRFETQRRLAWASEPAQRRAEGWDQGSLLLDCTRDGVLPSYRDHGWTDRREELAGRIGRPSMLIVGRQGKMMSPEHAQASATAWGAELVWMEESGHFPFVEEPERFAEVVLGFVAPPAP